MQAAAPAPPANVRTPLPVALSDVHRTKLHGVRRSTACCPRARMQRVRTRRAARFGRKSAALDPGSASCANVMHVCAGSRRCLRALAARGVLNSSVDAGAPGYACLVLATCGVCNEPCVQASIRQHWPLSKQLTEHISGSCQTCIRDTPQFAQREARTTAQRRKWQLYCSACAPLSVHGPGGAGSCQEGIRHWRGHIAVHSAFCNKRSVCKWRLLLLLLLPKICLGCASASKGSVFSGRDMP